MDQTRTQALQPVQGRSYFLERLLKQVIFGEALLVAHSPAATRRRLVLRTAGYAVAALLVVATAAVLWQVRSSGQREIDALATALAGYEQTARSLPLDPVADDDLARLAPLLDQARALPHGADEPSWLPAGLSQRDKLDASARAVYRHALQWALLPRLMWRLETQLRGNLNNPDFLYEATRVYLMLGNAGPLDASLVREWMKLDWQTAYPGLGFVPLREALLRHLDALLAEPLPQLQLDGELVRTARLRIATVPLAQRVYSRIRPSAAAQRLPEWRPSDALGPAGVPLFVRASGKPLTDGIPGFFTVDGFHKVLLPSLADAVKAVVSESWVLGDRVAFDPNGPQMQVLARDVVTLYEADYAPTWDLMLADLNVVQLRSLSQAAQDLYILASPESPMRRLLVSISRQLTLSVPPGGTRKAPEPEPSASSTQLRLEAVLGSSQPDAQAAPLLPGHEIDERYQALRDLVGHGPNAPIDLLLREVGDAQQQIAKLAATLLSTGSAPTAPGGIDPLLTLKTDAARQPQPVGRWLTEIATGAIALRSGDPRLQLATIFNAARRPGRAVPGGGERPLSVRADCDRRRTDRGLRATVRAGRRVRRLRQHAAATLCRYLGQAMAADLGRCRSGAGDGRGPRAVPARRDHPRRILRRWRDAAAVPTGHHAGQRRCGDAAGDAGSGWHDDRVYARRAAIDAGDVAEFFAAADDAAGVRSAARRTRRRGAGERAVGTVPAVRPRTDAGAGRGDGSLYADIPAWRAAGRVRRAGAGVGQSVGARDAAGLSLSERAGELNRRGCWRPGSCLHHRRHRTARRGGLATMARRGHTAGMKLLLINPNITEAMTDVDGRRSPSLRLARHRHRRGHRRVRHAICREPRRGRDRLARRARRAGEACRRLRRRDRLRVRRSRPGRGARVRRHPGRRHRGIRHPRRLDARAGATRSSA